MTPSKDKILNFVIVSNPKINLWYYVLILIAMWVHNWIKKVVNYNYYWELLSLIWSRFLRCLGICWFRRDYRLFFITCSTVCRWNRGPWWVIISSKWWCLISLGWPLLEVKWSYVIPKRVTVVVSRHLGFSNDLHYLRFCT